MDFITFILWIYLFFGIGYSLSIVFEVTGIIQENKDMFLSSIENIIICSFFVVLFWLVILFFWPVALIFNNTPTKWKL